MESPEIRIVEFNILFDLPKVGVIGYAASDRCPDSFGQSIVFERILQDHFIGNHDNVIVGFLHFDMVQINLEYFARVAIGLYPVTYIENFPY